MKEVAQTELMDRYIRAVDEGDEEAQKAAFAEIEMDDREFCEFEVERRLALGAKPSPFMNAWPDPWGRKP